MANIQFGGLVTGLDTNALISGLVNAERMSSIGVLQRQEIRFQAQNTVYTSLISSLANLKSAAQNLSLKTDFEKRAAVSSDTGVLTVSADSSAQTGSITVAIDTLAKAQTIRSASFTSASDVIGTGTLTIKVGDTSTPVAIDATNSTLSGLKDTINASGAAVRASIVNVGTGANPDYRLVLESRETGTENAVTVSGTLNGGADPFPGGGEIVQAAADAVFSVNGLIVTRSSNTISDVIDGVTFTLAKEGDRNGLIEPGDPTAKVTVSVDTGAITKAIHDFVSAFNAVNEIVNDQFELDPGKKQQGPLAGDASVRAVISRLRKELSAPGGIGVGFKFISDIGITFEKDGSLSVDEAKLGAALKSDPSGVSDLFVLVQNGIGKRIPDAIDDFISSVDGALTVRQRGIQASIENIQKKVAREEDRIAAYEEKLFRQFTALEQLVSQLRSQGDFLAQRLAALNGQ